MWDVWLTATVKSTLEATQINKSAFERSAFVALQKNSLFLVCVQVLCVFGVNHDVCLLVCAVASVHRFHNPGMTAAHTLDRLDSAVLRILQINGRATYDDIGAQIGLSPSAVLRRVKRLEDAGVIDRYVALVKPEAVGLGLIAYLNVRLEKHTESHKRNPMDLFRASVQTWPEVVECSSLTGEMDYLLRVVVQDMAHYSRFIMDTLLKHPSVQDCKTSFVLDRVKATTAVPV